MSQQLGRTARWAAAQRARESERPDRLFHDPLARLLAGDEGMEMLRLSDQYNPRREETAQFVAIRTRYFDDFLVRSVDGKNKQVVILAAGMDTRAFRLPISAETSVYELDQPEVLAFKEAVLRQNNISPPTRRIPVGVDLQADWTSALELAGFQRSEPSAWIIEGLLYYLEEPSVRRLLQGVSDCAAGGSSLAAELVSASYFRSPYTKSALDMMATYGTPWRWGSDDPEDFFNEFGWAAMVSQPGDSHAHFGRWTSALISREQREMPHAFLLSGRKK